MKFGDIVANKWAGIKNPYKYVMFLRKTSKRIYCLGIDGSSVQFYNNKDLRLKVVNSIDFSSWESHLDSDWKQAIPKESSNG